MSIQYAPTDSWYDKKYRNSKYIMITFSDDTIWRARVYVEALGIYSRFFLEDLATPESKAIKGERTEILPIAPYAQVRLAIGRQLNLCLHAENGSLLQYQSEKVVSISFS